MTKLRQIKGLQSDFNRWVISHYLQLAAFNLILILLVLLRSAGYFHPIFPLSINFVVFAAFILSVFLLGTRSWFFFLVTLLFWILAAFFKIALQIDVWAERAALYSFEALVLGVILLVGESFLSGSFHQKK